jgi:peptidoglycan/xylan/chitin deacetylase (PgdA/CDA1 family)
MNKTIIIIFLLHISFISTRKNIRKDNQPLKVYDKCTKPDTMALTFDDGPESATESHINYFTKKNIKVTFFFIAKNLLDPDRLVVAKKALNEGHEIGNHTYDHLSLTEILKSKSRVETLKQQLISSSELYRLLLGIVPKYFRPPYGDVDDSLEDLLTSLGFDTFLWNLDTRDWDWDSRRSSDKLAIVDTYKKAFAGQPGVREYIALQHEKSTNPEAELERIDHIVDLILSKGFKIVPLSACTDDEKGPYQKDVPDKNLIVDFIFNNIVDQSIMVDTSVINKTANKP